MEFSTVVARAYLSPEQAAALHVGDEATLLAGAGGKEIPAKVTTVSPAVDPNSTTVQVWVRGGEARRTAAGGSGGHRQHRCEDDQRCAGGPGGAVLTAPMEQLR